MASCTGSTTRGPTLRTGRSTHPGVGSAPADAMAILEGLSAVLDHVSRLGIVHRDLKPAILL